jgi:aspartate kinase
MQPAPTQPRLPSTTVSAPRRISVDVVATSEVSVSLTLDPKKLRSEGEDDLVQLKQDLDQVAQVRT